MPLAMRMGLVRCQTDPVRLARRSRSIARRAAVVVLKEGYVIEAHVPVSAIQGLLTERPDLHGLAVPGMPVGSPGMDVSGAEEDSYDVMAIAHDGTTTVFESHRFHG